MLELLMNYLTEGTGLDKYDNPINWINKHYDKVTKKRGAYKNSLAHDADKNIFHCKKCKKCWQYDKLRNNRKENKAENKKLFYYFNDFPSYGKNKVICPNCRENFYDM